MPPDRFTLVVPLKPLGAAKSRLRGAVPGVAHERLVLAIALDTVAAALSTATVGRVVVVTGDRGLAPTIAALGAECVPDAPAAGLNAALRHGARLAATEPVAALTADLPALRPAELAEALAAAALLLGQGYAADFAGTGTVLLTAPTGDALAPAFGPGSAAAHARSGATALAGAWPGLRRDVDTAADLAAAAELGVGPRTSALLPERPAPAATRRGADDDRPPGGGYGGATVHGSTR